MNFAVDAGRTGFSLSLLVLSLGRVERRGDSRLAVGIYLGI